MAQPVYIVMAIFRPNPDYLQQQIISLAAQDHSNFEVVFVISDKVSGDLVSELATASSLRFSVIVPAQKLDAVRGFETGLEAALGQSQAAEKNGEMPLIALCDQDDIWHADRLSRGVAALAQSGADLVHSDARLIDAMGNPTGTNMFAQEKRRKRPRLRGLLYRNNITGMTVLMHRRVLEIALPFPPQSGVHFYHDLWLGLVAAALSGVHLIDAPLVDYRQHESNAIGAIDRPKGLFSGIFSRLGKIDILWVRREAAGYALARYLAQSLQTRLLAPFRKDNPLYSPAKLRPLAGFLGHFPGAAVFLWDALKLLLTGQVTLARIALGFMVIGLGRSVWCLRLALTVGLKSARRRFDIRLYELAPGMSPESLEPEDSVPDNTPSIIDQRKSATWKPDFTADEPSLMLLLPTLNPTEIFAGVATAVDIGLKLAGAGHRIRFIATDLPMSSHDTSRRFVLGRLNAEETANGAADRITLHCGTQSETIPAHSDDLFMATAWWTAHVIDEILANQPFTQKRFLYLIQDFEPNFYPWGPEYADAWASYGMNFKPLFNTSLLRDYFKEQGFDCAKESSLCFHPSIDIDRYASGVRTDKQTSSPRRLALYGRPEVARNMFPTAIEALVRFIESEGLGPDDIEIVSMGLQHTDVSLPNGIMLNSLGKLPWESYPGYLLGVDLGLCLMYSPHPSHPPIEMAASGVRVVTNRFGSKDLSSLSPALLACEATGPALAEALSQAWKQSPVKPADRAIDLHSMGQSLDTVSSELAADLKARFTFEARS